jgi:hypothetical protein
MKTKTAATPLSRTFVQGFLVSVLAASLVPLLRAQELRVRVLNGRNGKPITNECLNMWIPTFYGAHIVGRTNKDGVVVLRVADGWFAADVACRGWPTRSSREAGADTITVSGDEYVACQEYAKMVPGDASNRGLMREIMPSYPIKRILESGVSAANTCGRYRAQAKPGELILYVRPRSFLEKLRM